MAPDAPLIVFLTQKLTLIYKLKKNSLQINSLWLKNCIIKIKFLVLCPLFHLYLIHSGEWNYLKINIYNAFTSNTTKKYKEKQNRKLKREKCICELSWSKGMRFKNCEQENWEVKKLIKSFKIFKMCVFYKKK